jgi:hypothetical protein
MSLLFPRNRLFGFPQFSAAFPGDTKKKPGGSPGGIRPGKADHVPRAQQGLCP